MHSMYFMARDTAWAALFATLAYNCLETAVPAKFLSVEMAKWVIGWNLYAFWMGTAVMGHWVSSRKAGLVKRGSVVLFLFRPSSFTGPVPLALNLPRLLPVSFFPSFFVALF